MKKFDLVLGTGPLGRAVAEALTYDGRSVKFASLSGRRGDLPHECLCIDLLAPNLSQEVKTGVDRLFMCAAPKYWRWPQELVPMVEGALQLARESGAPMVFADNLYAYGPSSETLTETTPSKPCGPKGQSRLQAAETILAAHAKGDVRTAIVRSSDFFGPGVDVSILGSTVFQNVAQGKSVNCLGDIDQPHTFNFIRDFARAMVNVISNEDCHGQVWHAPADEALSVREIVSLIAEECGTEARFNVAPEWLVRIMSLFDRSIRELNEVSYLYKKPLIMDCHKYERRFGAKTTPHRQAIKETLEDLNLTHIVTDSSKLA